MNNFNRVFNIEVKDNNVSVTLDKVNTQFKAVDQSVNKVNTTINNVTSDINSHIAGVSTKVGALNSTVTGATANISNQMKAITWNAITEGMRDITDSFKQFVDTGAGFEQSMADLSSITGIAGKDLNDLRTAARKTGKESGLGAKGAADAFALLASQI